MNENDKTKEQLVEELRVLKREMALMEKYRTIFENMQEAYYEAAFDGTVLEISPSIETISKGQYSRDEMIGKSFTEIYTNPDDRDLFFSELLRNGKVADYKLHLLNKDGSIVPVAISASILYDADGKPVKIAGMLRDITESVEAEKELAENQKVFRVLNELMSDYVFKLALQADGSFKMSVIAGNYSDATGRSVEDVKTAADWSKTIHPEDLNKLYSTLNQVLEQRIPIAIECRSFAEDGKLRWLEVTATPETDPLTNKVTAIYGSVRNITSKKLAAQNLQKSEERYRFIAERSNDLIYVYRLKPELGFDYVSPSAEKITGYTPEDHYNDPMLGIKLVHPDDRHLLQNIQEGVVKMAPYLMRWIKKDGQVIWTESQNIPIYDEKGDLVAIQGRATDVTERKRSELVLNTRLRIIEFAQLHSRNEIQQKLLDELELLTESQIGFFHAVNADQISLTLQSWSTNTIENMCKAEGHGQHYDIDKAGVWTDCVKQRKPVVHNDYNSLNHRKGMPEGHALVVRELVVPVFRNETIVAIVGVGNKPTDYNENDIDTVSLLADMAWDITERKGAEESMKKLSQIVEQSPVSILITNLDGTIEYANPKACETTGYTPGELVGINPRLLKSGETSDLDYNRLWQTITAGKHWNGIFHNRKKNGEFYWESATISPIVDRNGKTTHYLSIKEDITDRKQAEDDLKQREEDLNYSQEIAKMGNWELDLVNNKLKWSKNYYHLMGLEFSGGDAPPNYFNNHVHPDDIYLLDEKVREIHQTKKPTSIDMRIVMPDGKIKWIQNNIVPVFEGDRLIHLKGVNIDITEKKIAEEKIIQQNERLHAIIKAMPDLIFVIDRDGTYTEFYSSDIESLIVPPNQIIGTNLRSSFDESSARFHLQNINKCIDEKRLLTYEYSIPKSNSIGYFEARLAPIGSDRALISVRDITIRKEAEFEIRDLNQNLEFRIEKRTAQLAETNENLQLEIDERIKVSSALKEALERLHKIADQIPGVVYQFRLHTDGTYCFPYVSEGIYNILNVTPEAVVNEASNVFNKVHPDDLAPLYDSIFNSARNLAFWQHEYRVLPEDGREHWVGGNSLPQPQEDGSILWHGYISDITDRKLAEAEILAARNEAEKANQAKSEFLSRMSHELRTPMNSILGFAQLLQMGELTPRQKAGVGHILNSGKHLLNLINEVLDIARIESGKVPILHEPIKVQDIVVEMMDLVHPASLKQQQTIEFIDSPVNQLFVIADRQRLRQVLLNLTNNAIKYNCPNGKVTIKTAMGTNGPEETPVIKISITDMGLGISDDDLPKLFKPFERIGAEMTETEGTGLGLAVVKKLMDAMDGTVGVKSNLGTGSTFWIELPQSIAQGESVLSTSNTQVESFKVAEKTGTILYIEDNPSNVELVSQILLAQRPEILLISNKNGRMAVPLALEYSPDLILLDLDLPDIQGLEVLGLLKRKESVNQIPVVIISADAMPKQLEKLMKAGAENYLTKPLDIPIFLSVVDEWIGKEG